MIKVHYSSTLAYSLDIHPNRSKGTNNSSSTGLHTRPTQRKLMQSRTVPFHTVRRGGCQKGVAHVVHPSLKPLSAEAKRKRTRGKGGDGEVGIKR